MYRLAHNPGNDKIIVKLVSDQIIDCIETIFGPLNNEGHFTDINRVKEFMIRSEYLNNLVDENYTISNGLLKSEISWIHIIKNRYEDILLKVRDQYHEYTFNEMGEGLIYLIFEYFSNGHYEYLTDYEDTEDALDDHCTYLAIFERTNYENHYPGISEALLQAGRIAFDEIVLEDEEYDTIDEEWDRKEFSEYYEDIWSSYFKYICNFTYGGYLYTHLFDCTSNHDLGKKYNNIVIYDVLFWDNDFTFILSLLNDKKSLNKFIKDNSNYMGIQISNADMAIIDTNDLVYDI